MVEKIYITPEQVRGLGNIISPKEKLDYTTHHSTLSVTDNTYILTYNLGGITLTLSHPKINPGDICNITATVTDNTGAPLSGVTVEFYKEE